MAAKAFQIDVGESHIARLRHKLADTIYPSQQASDNPSDWSRGVPRSEIERLGRYWLHDYPWVEALSKLNRLPQYTLDIDVSGFGIHGVHFLHQQSARAHAIPLLFLHSWPGSFLEVTKLLGPLTDDSDSNLPAFNVVAPSLLDFGFSSPTSRPDFGIEQHAETYHKLMLALGYDQYVVQSGDIGNLITRFIVKGVGAGSCKACHTSTPWPAEPKQDTHPELFAKLQATPLTGQDVAALQRAGAFVAEGSGYMSLLSTKPQTIGYALRDSPIGLLAWIFEKLHDWADEYPWTDEEIITWTIIYYFSTAGPQASGNIYYAMQHSTPPALVTAQSYINVPLGITRFAKDLVVLPSLWYESLGPIVFENEYERGGHFGAWERPDAIVADLRSMFGRGGGAYGSVTGRSGFAGDCRTESAIVEGMVNCVEWSGPFAAGQDASHLETGEHDDAAQRQCREQDRRLRYWISAGR
ncbi:Alpha/Beta hydrolase protein [Neohortaea acidophila]|uniref:Alpha/Beta hydrolase protein n=1 Tax=Neohortaea acidophila TaxID=245834 RepID=A0A6A6PN89_9PEZI|nr:Alpha/Beta hydrolase protein [Neohortaea acidophila]KAF2481568.1 Alpha/Beta hydrolase protein [Neohortaea acidophila]